MDCHGFQMHLTHVVQLLHASQSPATHHPFIHASHCAACGWLKQSLVARLPALDITNCKDQTSVSETDFVWLPPWMNVGYIALSGCLQP